METEITKKKVLECPHCKGLVEVVMGTEIVHLQRYSEAMYGSLMDLAPSQQSVIELIEQPGLMKSFAESVRFVLGDESPKSIERYFATFLRTVQLETIPRFALDLFLKELTPHGKFQFWISRGVGAVVIGNVLRAFVPVELVLGTPARSTATPANPTQLKNWLNAEGRKLTADQQLAFSQVRKLANSV
ncbi:MAG: hypothetical protein ABI430_03925 [Candidatus Taylorbacteria bacterium]